MNWGKNISMNMCAVSEAGESRQGHLQECKSTKYRCRTRHVSQVRVTSEQSYLSVWTWVRIRISIGI